MAWSDWTTPRCGSRKGYEITEAALSYPILPEVSLNGSFLLLPLRPHQLSRLYRRRPSLAFDLAPLCR